MQEVSLAVALVLCLVGLLIGAGIAGFLCYRKGVSAGAEQRKQQAEAAIGSAEKEAGRILEDATDALKSAVRNAGFSRRKKIWTKRRITWSGRKSL